MTEPAESAQKKPPPRNNRNRPQVTLTLDRETVRWLNEQMDLNRNRYRSYGQLVDGLVKYLRAWEPFIEKWGRRGVREIEAAMGVGKADGGKQV